MLMMLLNTVESFVDARMAWHVHHEVPQFTQHSTKMQRSKGEARDLATGGHIPVPSRMHL